jgi:hypothetical protein
MKPNLESARLKLERSQEFLDQLAAEQAESRTTLQEQFANTPPLEARTELHPDGWWNVVRCTDALPIPPPRWALVVGDAMHNARSALDHLACRLVELAGHKPGNRTAFPIRKNKPTTQRETDSFEAAIKGMKTAHKDSIRKLQPYANPGTDEARHLLALAAMDNADKHELLLPRNSALDPNPPPPTGVYVDIRWNAGVALAPGVEVIRYKPGGVGGWIFPRVRVTYGDGETGLPELRQIRSYVVGIVESFAPEFS